jgi:membrane fusion protein (multidrug efflux system)
MSNSDTETTENENGRLSGFVKVAIFVALLGAGGLYGARYYIESLPFEKTDDAFIDGDIIAISPQVSGEAVEVLVDSNQDVEAGELLLVIDPEYYEGRWAHQTAAIELAEARRRTAETTVELVRMTTKARVQQVESELLEIQAGFEEARAQVKAAEAEAVRAELEHERQQRGDESIFTQRESDYAESLVQVARAELSKAKNGVAAAQAAIEVVEARLIDALSGRQLVKVRESEVAQYAAEVKVERAALKQVELDLRHTKIYAPCAGRVTRKSVDAGEQVRVGQRLLAIVPKEVWVEANFRETQLTDMRPGQPVEIRVDTYPRRVFMGRVESIQSGSGARFSLLPPENATGNYVKIVQRIPVKIVFDESPGDEFLLVPGMSVVPRVRVR